MRDELCDCGSVKRDDLQLRLKYYGLKTKIYLIAHYHYAIQMLNYHEMYNEIKCDFDNNIHRLGSWVELVKEVPANILEEIEPITNVAYKNEGIFLTHQLFKSLLVSRFPNVNFISTCVEHINGIIAKIFVDVETKKEDIDNIKNFVMDMKLAYTEVKVEKVCLTKDALYEGDVGLACTDKKFKFSIEDSEFWFDNVEKIYSGEVAAEDLRFFDGNKTKCYLDFSVWENRNINIRSTVLLYDTVYISFPLGMHMEDFLSQQHLTVAELQTLVERDKLVILLPNTEGRYDRQVIESLYQINNKSVVSKRGINTLMATYYCQLEKQYMSFWKGHESDLEAFCMDCMKSKDSKQKMLSDILLWPVRAKVESYELLTSYSPLKLPSIGANTLFDLLPENTPKRNDIMFELIVNSNTIHIASALQATYFPFCAGEADARYTDVFVANILGSVLNAYQYWGKNQREDIEAYTEMLNKERNAIYLLKSENNVDLKHIVDYAEKYDTTHTLKNILQKLTVLEEEERKEKIREYSNLIAEIGKENIGSDKVLNYVLSAAGFIPGIGTGASIVSLILQVFEDSKLKDKWMLKRIADNKATKKEEVYLLDKLSRVAKIE